MERTKLVAVDKHRFGCCAIVKLKVDTLDITEHFACHIYNTMHRHIAVVMWMNSSTYCAIILTF